jgi:hypothetical protein
MFLLTYAPGTGHWAPGTGHWALGTGHWALGTGHWALGLCMWLTYEAAQGAWSVLARPWHSQWEARHVADKGLHDLHQVKGVQLDEVQHTWEGSRHHPACRPRAGGAQL